MLNDEQKKAGRLFAFLFIIQHSSFIIFLQGSSLTVQYLFSVAMISTNAWRVTGFKM